MTITPHTERARRLVDALAQTRLHVAAAGAMPAGADCREELLEALECLLEALEISAGVVYHGKPRPVPARKPPAPAPEFPPESS